MNEGKICVSICADTAEGVLERIRHAFTCADIVEVRFDCLTGAERGSAIAMIAGLSEQQRQKILATLRPLEQGGAQDLFTAERREFWKNVSGLNLWGSDLEEDVFADSPDFPNKILSFHDFSGLSANIPDVFQRLASSDADIIKVAAEARDTTDSIPVWDLIHQAKENGRKIVPIAMGEFGKWTRILGLSGGAYMTYASLGTGSGTAAGQISADDLINVYRVKELNDQTEVYGLIAGDTSYSVSPFMHNAAFKTQSMNSVFVPFQVTDLRSFVDRMIRPATREIELNFRGFAVTNPHKQAIIPLLDMIDDAATQIGAVNTIRIENGKMIGMNTDAAGFIKPLRGEFSGITGSRVAVIGAGGAARAVIYALKNEGADVSVFARDALKGRDIAKRFGAVFRQYTAVAADDFSDFDIIINTTPLGTRGPQQNLTVAAAGQMNGVKLVYDLIYNPAKTRLMSEAEAAGAKTLGGLEMLISQGARQFEIWTGETPPLTAMSNAVRQRLEQTNDDQTRGT